MAMTITLSEHRQCSHSTHTHHRLLGKNLTRTFSKEIQQAQTYEALHNYHAHQKWREYS